MNNPSLGSCVNDDSNAKGTITNDDTGLRLTQSSQYQNKPEGQSGTVDFSWILERFGDTTTAFSMPWSVESNGNIDANDFKNNTLPSGTVKFNAGDTQATIVVTVSGDTTVEIGETFSLDLSRPGNVNDFFSSLGKGLTPLYTATLYGTINRDEGEFKISGEQVSADENATLVSTYNIIREDTNGDANHHYFKIERVTSTAGEATVSWKVSETGPFSLNGVNLPFRQQYVLQTGANVSDFVAGQDTLKNNSGMPSGTITFADGQTYGIIDILTVDDTLGETNETFKVSLTDASAGNGLVQGVENRQATGTIQDNDPLISLGSPVPGQGFDGSREFIEGQTAYLYVVRSLNTSQTDLVDWSISFANPVTSGSTSNNFKGSTADFANTDLLSGTITFNPGETTKAITLNPINDNLRENWVEQFTVTLSNPRSDGGTLTPALSPLATTMSSYIIDANRTLVNVDAKLTNDNALEGTGSNGAQIVYTITRQGDDPGTGQIAWVLKTPNTSQDDVASIAGDTTGVNYSTGIWQGMVTFGKDDPVSKTVVVNVSPDSAVESLANFSFSLVDGYAVNGTGSDTLGGINYGGQAGVILGNSNYKIVDSGNLVRDPYDNMDTSIKIKNDDSRLRVDNTYPNNDTLLVVVGEGDSGTKDLTLNLTRYGKIDNEITVDYQVLLNSTADAKDVTVSSGTWTLPAGTATVSGNDYKSYSFTIDDIVSGDTTRESNEAFTVRLTSNDTSSWFNQSSKATSGTKTYDIPVTIVNDDTTWSLSAATTSQVEPDNGSLAYTFTITRPNSGDSYGGSTSVSWKVTGSGTNPADTNDFSSSASG
ncbi:MAG: hypothetical protein G8345_22350, partial [Magnetococcales bacterium]|nr:hypothetical protein [Magnetococcales bacterium]